ncbi:uncharacterized protein FFUJ_04304 [Fusarium fujikuroi IMI 58289]|uniref:Myb/SANT-like domain-containing protein n=1 Tax=Gibberella fujikuroi (strain CBS 195.34 / IMI 58289 / NRRL A-6831) TaxID=1279085 RepID=S0DSU3_GIBF5|nr:uncharacterized protein FFUJ_04304 [Fusarium fujikuroi IMI 58289]CCT64472.1 uncharacterized protein FFUJ_04304 [Fusarium fujikuroi IMI 58289]
MPASSQQPMAPPARSEEEISTASESEAEEEIEVPSSQPAPSQSLPARRPTARQNASKRATRRAPRSDIQNPGSKARWTRDQMEYLLESYGAKRIGCELAERYPPNVFDQTKVGRKLGELLRNWKAFLAIMRETSGAGYDHELGIVTTTDDNWDRWVKKHGIGAAAIKRNGLQKMDLYQRAFDGVQEVGLTALEVTDTSGLLSLRNDMEESQIDSQIDEDLVFHSQPSAHEAAQRHLPSRPSPSPFREVTATPAPSSSQTSQLTSSPSGRPSHPTTSSSGDSQSPQRVRRPHRHVDPQAGSIEKAVSKLVTSREKSRRPIGADDTQSAVQDVQQRFLERADEGEIETFFDWLLGDSMRAVFYNSLNERMKERLFCSKSGCIVLRSPQIDLEMTQDSEFDS